MSGGEFTFATRAQADLRGPRWLRGSRRFVVLGLAVVLSIFVGEAVKDHVLTSRLSGPWIGEESDPDGLWTREVAYDFRADGTVRVTLRFQRAGEARPEETTRELAWRIRHAHLILTSPETGDIATRIQRLHADALTFGGQPRIREFRRPAP